MLDAVWRLAEQAGESECDKDRRALGLSRVAIARPVARLAYTGVRLQLRFPIAGGFSR